MLSLPRNPEIEILDDPAMPEQISPGVYVFEGNYQEEGQNKVNINPNTPLVLGSIIANVPMTEFTS